MLNTANIEINSRKLTFLFKQYFKHFNTNNFKAKKIINNI